MTKFFVFVVISLQLLSCRAQAHKNQFFEKKEVDCDFKNTTQRAFYRIEFVDKTTFPFPCSYFHDFKQFKEATKIAMIEELLDYEGDTTLSAMKVSCYNPARSQLVPIGIDNYSIQVEALFMINHIISADPYAFAAYPILRNKDTLQTISGELINRAFFYYRKWLRQIKLHGLHQMIEEQEFPLHQAGDVSWY